MIRFQKKEILKLTTYCGGEEDESNSGDLLEAASKILFGNEVNNEELEQQYQYSIEKIIQEMTGTTHSEQFQKLNGSAAFIGEHQEKCKDELSLYSLVTYLMHLNGFEN